MYICILTGSGKTTFLDLLTGRRKYDDTTVSDSYSLVSILSFLIVNACVERESMRMRFSDRVIACDPKPSYMCSMACIAHCSPNLRNL